MKQSMKEKLNMCQQLKIIKFLRPSLKSSCHNWHFLYQQSKISTFCEDAEFNVN